MAEQLLLAVKMDEPTDVLIQHVESLSMADLQTALQSDNQKKTFWINSYNAWFLILRKYRKVDKKRIYTEKLFTIAGQAMSLDDVEHGILRKYRYKFSLGYLPNPFAPSIIRKLAVSNVDYRLHFALNCGAISCPPIAFYHEADIDTQLDMATRSFLESDVNIDHAKKIIHISRLMLWYKGDFGGSRGIRAMLKQVLDLEPRGYTLTYKPYNWEESLDNFTTLGIK